MRSQMRHSIPLREPFRTALLSASSSWTPSKPLGGETPTQWFTSRSGVNLVDSLGGASLGIQLPYLYKPLATEYAKLTDNQALDIVNNLGQNGGSGDYGFTFAMWVKHEATAAIAYIYGGKYTNATNGLYAFAVAADNKPYVVIRSSGGAVTITASTAIMADNGWHFLLFDVNSTDLKVRFFVDNVQIGSDTSYTGTFAAMAAGFEFYIGIGNGATVDGALQYPSKTSHSDTYVYPFILTPAQQTTLFTRGYVIGTKAHWDMVPREDNIFPDLSGNGYHMTEGTNCLKSTKIRYGAGSRKSLEVGYTLWTDFPNKEIQVPYSDADSELAGYSPVGYTKIANYIGISGQHNMADSCLLITGVDRSNTTTCSYLARSTSLQHYYDSTAVSQFHVQELYNLSLSNYFNDEYRGLRFSKITNRVLTDFYTYTTNKTGTNYDKPIIYSGETSVMKFDVTLDTHIVAIKGSKVLKFNDAVPYTLSLSLDGGSTYSITKATPGVAFIDHGYIFDNGNILFCDNTKCYYSTDNLSTYTESTVLDYQGNAFVPGTQFNFRPYDSMLSEVTTGGTKLYTWGTYATGGSALNVPNQWYTIDNGATIKSGYLFGSSIPALVATHIHSIKYDSVSDTFFMCTGDGATNKCNIMQGTYTPGTDTWAWTSLGKGNAGSVWETDGFEFTTDYIYIANEGTTVAYRGLRRLLRTDIASIATLQETIFTPNIWTGGVAKIGNFYVICHVGADNKITFSTDLVNFSTRIFDELVFEATYGGYIVRGVLPNGYIVFTCFEVGENLGNYPKGNMLLVKPSLIS